MALVMASVRDAGLRAVEAEDEDELTAKVQQLDWLCDIFLDSYSELISVHYQRVALWEGLDALTSLLHCWSKVKFDRLTYKSYVLRRLMDQGMWTAA